MIQRFVFMLALLPLAACASVAESRVESALRDAGLSERMAGCMAERMVDKLSITQLRRLESLGDVGDRGVRDMTVDEFLHRVRALRDPEIVAVTSKAGVGCALRL